MVYQLLSSNLYSHENKLLEEHLINVSRIIELFLDEKPSKLKNDFSEVAKIIGLTHDLGKATKYFQDYLLADENQKFKLKTPETNHSFFSAICTYFATKEVLRDGILSILAYTVVRRHHSDLIDIIDELSEIKDEKINLVFKQLDSLEEDKFNILSENLSNAGFPIKLEIPLLRTWFQNFRDEIRKIKYNFRNINDIKYYFTLNFLYSLLLDADKSEVVIKDINVLRKRLDLNNDKIVENYILSTKLDNSTLNELRTNAFVEVQNYPIDLTKKIYSIILPTGFGKTFCSFSFALRLRNQLEKNGIKPRIVYTLPFLSIIDQNSKVLQDVLKFNNYNIDSTLFLTHHHLSEISYKSEEQEFETDVSKILVEGWNSEIIITTFVQLFHTLVSNKNKSIRKFHKLANSIIILDEIQALPIKYWDLIREIFLHFSEQMNLYLIITTATEPFIFNEAEVTPILEKTKYFKAVNRIKLIPEMNEIITIEEVQKYLEKNKGKKALVIFNTISTAKKFYNIIKEKYTKTTYLSTHLIPVDRLKRIDEIKEGKYDIVVSTQLVEAGVDIDFELVFRDLAPLDSINQSAGRCNRNAKSNGLTYIFKSKGDTERINASYIYDITLLNITERILAKKNVIEENDFISIIEEYFKTVQNEKCHLDSSKILEAIFKLKYDKANEMSNNYDNGKVYKTYTISSFNLIDDDIPKVDIFIEKDQRATQILNEYCKILSIKDRWEKLNKFLELKKDFYSYVVSIPIYKAKKNLPPQICNIRVVPNSQLNEYYDEDTGFKIEGEVVLW